jgi:hypothetical protein
MQSNVCAGLVVVTLMCHVAHNLKISTKQQFVVIYDIQAIFCTQFIVVSISIHLTNFIFLDIACAAIIKY